MPGVVEMRVVALTSSALMMNVGVLVLNLIRLPVVITFPGLRVCANWYAFYAHPSPGASEIFYKQKNTKMLLPGDRYSTLSQRPAIIWVPNGHRAG
jgi:hypothetical protein